MGTIYHITFVPGGNQIEILLLSTKIWITQLCAVNKMTAIQTAVQLSLDLNEQWVELGTGTERQRGMLTTGQSVSTHGGDKRSNLHTLTSLHIPHGCLRGSFGEAIVVLDLHHRQMKREVYKHKWIWPLGNFRQ